MTAKSLSVRPPSDRFGVAALFAIYMSLLAGRFDLKRLSADLPSFDLRVIAVGGCFYLWLLWRAADARDRDVAAVGTGFFGAASAMLAVWMAATALWAPIDARVNENLTDIAVMSVLVAMAWSVYSRLSSSARAMPWWWAYGAGVLYVLAAIAAGPDVLGRYSAFGGGPNVFVRVVLLGAIAAIVLASERHLRWPLLAVPVLIVGAVLSGSRGGLIAMLGAFSIGSFRLFRKMSRSLRRWIFVLAILGAVLIVRVVSSPQFAALYDRYVVSTLQQGYTSGRDRISGDAWLLFVQNPIVGVGVDGYYGLVGRTYGGQYPHNLPLAVAAESGLIGVTILLAALVSAVVALSRRGASRASLFLALAALFILVASLFSGDYYDSRFLWLFLGWAVIEARTSSSQAAHPAESRLQVAAVPVRLAR